MVVEAVAAEVAALVATSKIFFLRRRRTTSAVVIPIKKEAPNAIPATISFLRYQSFVAVGSIGETTVGDSVIAAAKITYRFYLLILYLASAT